VIAHRGYRRLAAATAVTAVVVVALGGAITTYTTALSSNGETIAAQRETLGRLAAHVRDRRNGSVDGQVIAPNRADLFLAGESDAVRQSGLQVRIAELLRSSGLMVRSTRTTPASERDGLRMIGSEVHATGTIAQVQMALLRLESARPVLIVQSIHVSASANSAAVGDDRAGVLDVRLAIAGLGEKSEALQ
jgi:hypothetical protein